MPEVCAAAFALQTPPAPPDHDWLNSGPFGPAVRPLAHTPSALSCTTALAAARSPAGVPAAPETPSAPTHLRGVFLCLRATSPYYLEYLNGGCMKENCGETKTP